MHVRVWADPNWLQQNARETLRSHCGLQEANRPDATAVHDREGWLVVPTIASALSKPGLTD